MSGQQKRFYSPFYMESKEQARKRSKETYDWYKEHGICAKCGQHDAVPGRVCCELCLVNEAIASAKYRANTPEKDEDRRVKMRARHNERRQEHKDAGICVLCNKPATHGVYCIDHWVVNARKNQERYRKKNPIKRSERTAYGLCYFCGKPALQGKKSCKECRDRILNNLGGDTKNKKKQKEYVKKQIEGYFKK